MTHKFAVLGLGLAIAALASATNAFAGPAISTRWKETTMSQDDCLFRAETAIRASGFGQIERTP